MIKASREEAAKLAKAERKAQKKAEKAKSLELAKKRQKKDVNLNGRTSLTGRQDRSDSIKCYTCGGPHVKAKCPQNNKRLFEGGFSGPSKKARI